MTDYLKNIIRTIPNYPKPGILFRDITTLLGDARAFRRAIDELVQPWPEPRSTRLPGWKRGVYLRGAVAHQLSAGSCRSAKRQAAAHQSVDRLFA